MEVDKFNEYLERAMALGRARHEGVDARHHAAFANSVANLLTGVSGGYGGPSMREHCAGRQKRTASFDEAVAIAEPICYGPMTVDIARTLVDEHCFDDPEGDEEAARAILRKEGVAFD